MKGYYLINTDITNHKAHSIQILKTIEGMRSAGLDVELVCPRYKQFDSEKLFSDYVVENPVPIKQLWIPADTPGRLAFFYFTVAVGFWVFVQNLKGNITFIYIRSEYLFPLVPLFKIFGIPFFYEIHRVGLNKRIQNVKTFIAKYATGIIVLTQVLKKEFVKYNHNVLVEHDAVMVEHIQTNLSKKDARSQFNIDQDATLVLYAGSVQKIKGVDLIIRAAKNFPEVQFYIVGTIYSNMLPELDNAPHNVRATGGFSQAELPIYLKAADLLVLPHPEGPQSQSPMKLFEYMASGKPVLSADLPNIREVLPSENFFYTPGSVDSFKKQLCRFIKKNNDFHLIGSVNYRVAQNHSWAKRGKRIVSFINDLI